MDTKYSNYDMFDKLIVNNKKAQSWTLFWVIALCLLAGVVIFLAITNSKQKRTIADLNVNADYKSKVIDSLKGILQKEVDKKVDSISDYISTLNTSIQEIENQSENTGVISDIEQASQKENFKVVNNSIRELNNKVQQIKTDLKKDRLRFFIQYNNRENSGQVNELTNYLKKNDNYFIAPAELLNSNFKTSIKIYNYNNEAEEIKLKEIISKIFNLPPRQIKITHVASGSGVTKPTIEIWIGTLQTPVQNPIHR